MFIGIDPLGALFLLSMLLLIVVSLRAWRIRERRIATIIIVGLEDDNV